MMKQSIMRTCIVLTILFGCSISLGNAQELEHRDYLLKKVGNLYILNVGANDGVKEYNIYNLYFEKAKRLPFLRIKVKTVREYFGTVQVTQLFPEYCVVRIISKVMEEEPAGNRIVLVPKGLPEEIIQRAAGVVPENRRAMVLSKGTPQDEPIVKSLDSDFKDASYKPFSIGINYFRDFDQIARPITNNLISDLNTNIYTNEGIFSSSFSSNGGISIVVSKMLMNFLAVEGGMSFIEQKSTVNSFRNPEFNPPVGLISVKNWDFDIQTKILNWSLTLQVSQFSKAVSYFTGQPLGRRFTPRFGIGLDYATVDVSLNHNVQIEKLTQDESRSLTDKKSMGGYWGMHIVAGIDYYLQVVKFFAEVNYYTWITDKFKSNVPFRVGASINF